ncbi:MAG: GGDEF domain-containing protein [Elusimicrobia bacterium]|nr:GGDEF domain-containing protein [Elusimicrobiota bacterium]
MKKKVKGIRKLIRLYRIIDECLICVYSGFGGKKIYPPYLRKMWRCLEKDEEKHLIYWRYLEDRGYGLDILTPEELKKNIASLNKILRTAEELKFRMKKETIDTEEALDNTVNIEFNALMSPMQKLFYTHDIILDRKVFNPKEEYDIHLKRVTDGAGKFYPAGSFKRTMINSFVGIKHEKEKMNEEAVTDSLTGLKNRKYFFENAQFMLNVAKREGKPAAVLMFDLNKFKNLNDTYGHRAGDAALKKFGNLLKKRLRSSDIAARFGGDEFVLFLYGQNEAGAVQFLNRFSCEIAKLKINVGEGIFVKIETSVGYAVHSPLGRAGLKLLLSNADKRMYKDKNG